MQLGDFVGFRGLRRWAAWPSEELAGVLFVFKSARALKEMERLPRGRFFADRAELR